LLAFAIRVVNVLIVAAYSIFFLPTVFFGIVASFDYSDRGCPGANQCSDAQAVMTIALVYVCAAPVIWVIAILLRRAAAALAPPEREQIPAGEITSGPSTNSDDSGP
jgi:hypothetical protein